MNALLDVVVPAAKGLIDEDGSFAPFGAVADTNGEIKLVVPTSQEEDVPMERVLEGLNEVIQESALEQSIRAAAVCTDVHMREPTETDAIHVLLEHADAEPLSVLIPYATRGSLPTRYGEHIIQPAEPEIFS
jgi:hypothetical protein